MPTGGVADMCIENFFTFRWGTSNTVKGAETGSKDPHRRERRFSMTMSKFLACMSIKNIDEIVQTVQCTE